MDYRNVAISYGPDAMFILRTYNADRIGYPYQDGVTQPQVITDCKVQSCVHVGEDNEIRLQIKPVNSQCLALHYMLCKTGYTFMAWVRVDSRHYLPRFQIFGNHDFRHKDYRLVDFNWELYFDPEETNIRFQCNAVSWNNASAYGSWMLDTGPLPINPYNWFHIACVCPPELRKNSGIPEIYVQGKRYGSFRWYNSKSYVENLQLWRNDLHLGYNMTILEASEGDIDEVFMWYRVISPKMIRYIHRKQKGNKIIKMQV